VFTILTEYGSYLVDGEQIDRLNAAKRARAVRVALSVVCRCFLHEGSVERTEITLSDVVGVVGHSKALSSNVIPFQPVSRSA
jgi:uncharacterized protein (UPF0179 family)